MPLTHLLATYWINHQFESHFNQSGGAKKWTSLEHNGVLFPPEYIPHHIPILYESIPIELNPTQEEYATLYAKYLETDYIKNKTFNRNFWNDWKQTLGKDHQIQSLDNCDFTQIYNYLLKIKESLTPEQRKLNKQARDIEEEKYKTALVDGKPQPVGNFRMEPPGIFLGRGCNPKLGRVKKRIYPEDIIINIGSTAKIPNSLPGHNWQEVIHDNNVEWLASWKDDITNKIKYVWLAAHSDLKTKNDKLKFDLARKLKRNIKRIREMNNINLSNNDPKIRQIATALYFIDNFALRVGNEKGEDEADTVGITSLRVEHLDLLPNNNIKLDFLGKDSVRYNKVLPVSDKVYSNIKEFQANKLDQDNLFDLITSNDLNKYLQGFMTDLTAKVFRTYNASNLFQKELKKINKRYETYSEADKVNILLDEFNKANAKVALLCNHQKNIAKSTNKQLENLDNQIKKAKLTLRKAKKTGNQVRINTSVDKLKKLRAKKQLKIELKNISLGTSKVNYIDPRITVAFLKKHDLPIDKLFSKTLQDKFQWAFEVDSNYRF